MPSHTRITRIVSDPDRPRLAPHVQLTYDPVREQYALLAPETVSVLNGTGATILGLCDGRRTVAEIVAELRRRFDHVVDDEVRLFLARLIAMRCLDVRHGEVGSGQVGHG